jgi:hypothetical protein
MYGGCGRLLQHRQPAGVDAKLSQRRFLWTGTKQLSMPAGILLLHQEALRNQDYSDLEWCASQSSGVMESYHQHANSTF